MAVFKYEANWRNKPQEGVITAENTQDAIKILRDRNYIVKDLQEIRSSISKDISEINELTSFELKKLYLISGAKKEEAMRQLSVLLQAGVPILTALKITADQSKGILSKVLFLVAKDIEKGKSLEVSLRTRIPVLGEITLGLVAAGEANGTVDQMFEFSAMLMERNREIRNNIIQAMVYPVIVVLMTFGVGYFLLTKVIPKVTKFIADRSGEMPWITRSLIDVSEFIKLYGIYFIIVPVCLAATLILCRRNEEICAKIDFYLLKIPLFGKMFTASSNAIWSQTLALLLKSGITIVHALTMTERTIKNRHIRNELSFIKKLVTQGQPLSTGVMVTTIGKSTPLIEAMVKIGENTGNMDQGLSHIARISSNELQKKLNIMMKMIEPALFVIVGGMVGYVYIAFFLGLVAASRGGS